MFQNQLCARSKDNVDHSRHYLQELGSSILAATSLLLSGCSAPRTYLPEILPALAPTTRSQANPEDIRVLTHNIEGLPSTLLGLRKGRFQELKEQFRNSGADAILIQENWFQASSRSFPPEYYSVTARVGNVVFKRSGLAILLKEPPLKAQAFSFTYESGVDAIVSKGALMAQYVTGNGNLVELWCAHLQAGNREVCSRQISELCSWIQQRSSRFAYVVVGLDANCQPGDSEYAELVEKLGDRFSTHQDLVTHIEPKSGKAQRLDHIFVRPPERINATEPNRAEIAFTVGQGKDRLSDHLPVLLLISTKHVAPELSHISHELSTQGE